MRSVSAFSAGGPSRKPRSTLTGSSRRSARSATGTRLVDLGSGGGLPGLVLADAYPERAITLVDRREKRTDFLRRAVRRLGWEHVTVMHRRR